MQVVSAWFPLVQWSPAPDVPRPGNVCPLSLAAGWCCPEHAKHAESDSEAKEIYLQINAT